MTQFYLWYFPDANKAIIKSIGLADKRIVYMMEDGETEESFKERAISAFNKQYEEWLDTADLGYQKSEILATKILP